MQTKPSAFRVSEATPYCAYLSLPDGHDVVTLHRVLPDEVTDPEHKAACLTDEQWQAVINLVDAALLAALIAKDASPTPSERSAPVHSTVRTMLDATDLLADLKATHEFPGYIAITAHGRTFHFGDVDGTNFTYDSHPEDDDSVSIGGASLPVSGASLPVSASAADLAAWVRCEVARHADHPIFFRTLGSIGEAKELLRYLHDNGLTFHCEDDPAECRLPITPVAAQALRLRMKEAYLFNWSEADGGCPCGYAISLDPEYVKAEAGDAASPAPAPPVNPDPYAKLERFRCLSEYLADDLRRLVHENLVDLGDIEADHPRIHILRQLMLLEDALSGVEGHHILP